MVNVECHNEQDHQTLLNAKYCPRVAAVLYTQKNTRTTYVTLTLDLEILCVSSDCQDTTCCRDLLYYRLHRIYDRTTHG